MQIARRYGGEIIAADSRTVYRGMDIGTAKPTAEDKRQVPHHLLDVRDPNEKFSAAEFKRLAEAAICDISKRGRLPVLVGGTGLYVDSVIFDFRFGPAADLQRREYLNTMTIQELRALCSQNNIDLPINSQNKRHLVRSIELGGSVSSNMSLRPNTIVVGITTDKAILRERIERRIKQMIGDGLLDEIACLGGQYGWDGEAMKGNVYRVFRGVVEGSKTLDEAISESVQSDVSLAKRQMTWLKRNPHIVWSGSPIDLLNTVDTFLSQRL
jgi:tRNA dimethylallyltransferase